MTSALSTSNNNYENVNEDKTKSLIKVYCVVSGCYKHYKHENISMHKFPKNLKLCKIWIDKCKITKKITNYHRICSDHFDEKDFFRYDKNKRRMLFPHAIPSRKLPTSIDEALKLQSCRTPRKKLICVNNLKESNDTSLLHTSESPLESHNTKIANQKPIVVMKIKNEILETDSSNSLGKNKTCKIFNEPERIEEVLIKCEPIIDEEPIIKDEPIIDDVTWVKKEINEEFVIKEDLDIVENNTEEADGLVNNVGRENSENGSIIDEEPIIKDEPIKDDVTWVKKEINEEFVIKEDLDTVENNIEEADGLINHVERENSENESIQLLMEKNGTPLGNNNTDVANSESVEEHDYCKTRHESFCYSINSKADKLFYSSERPFTCDICPKAFYQKKDLKIHKVIHSGERPFTCDVCQKTFTQLGSLITHTRSHSSERPYACDICQKTFYWKNVLLTHKRIHSGERPYACDVCQKTFTESGHLKIHRRVHSDERPYTCNICQRSFTQLGHLKTHERFHSNERPYTCDICQKAFYQKSDLKRHERTHSNKRSHACDVCEKKFTQSCHLKLHKEIHSNKRPSFACDICQKKFDRKDTLVRHKRIHSSN